MFRLRRLFRPLSRPAALLLAWQHRKTLAMWARSIRAELDHARATGRPDTARWKALLPAMWRNREAAERGTVDALRVTADGRVVARDEYDRLLRDRPVGETFAGVTVVVDDDARVAVG